METKTEIGVIESLNTSTGNSKGKDWTRYEIVVNGMKYSTFDAEMAKTAKVGATITLNLEKSDKYWQIKDYSMGGVPTTNAEQKERPSLANYNGVTHKVMDNMTSDELAKALNEASSEFNVFATQTHFVDGKWNAVIFMR